MKLFFPQPTAKSIQTIACSFLLLSGSFLMSSCNNKQPEAPEVISRDQVYNAHLEGVRLGDGVPLNIDVSVRWKIENYATFSNQFESPEVYDSLILAPRQLELASKVSNTFESVDSVFTTQRHAYISSLKNYLLEHLGEDGVTIKEVIVSGVVFPQTYTAAREQMAMQERELERIRKSSVIALESAESDKKQANAQGEVDMVKAQMSAKIEQINAETEKSRRKNELARAETQKQVARLQAEAEAEKRELLADADVNNKRKQNQLEVEKQKDMDQLVFNKDMQMAQLCSENPVYANYMVNKELAGKVQIAVLPSGQDASVFNGLLGNQMATK